MLGDDDLGGIDWSEINDMEQEMHSRSREGMLEQEEQMTTIPDDVFPELGDPIQDFPEDETL